jgi:hypothetical protein
MSLLSVVQFLPSLLSALCVYFLSLRYLSFRIANFYPLSVSFSYSHDSFLISSSRIRIKLHLPRPSDPRWASIIAHNYKHQSKKCTLAIARVDATLWVFPHLLRVTGGPWVSVELADCDLLVFTSRATPTWVERIRTNLVKTVLRGHQLRLHTIRVSIVPGIIIGQNVDEEEFKVIVSLDNYHVRSWQGRVYSFGRLDGCWSKSWVDGRGSLVIITQESSRRVNVPPPPDGQTRAHWSRYDLQGAISGTWTLLITSVRLIGRAILYWPSDTFKAIRDPMSMIDLYVPLAQVTFEEFRLRDADLMGPIISLMLDGWMQSKDVIWDTLIDVLSMTDP